MLRPFVPIVVCLVMVGSELLPGDRATAAERPNIVFVFSDDHAVQAISAYGSRLLSTPNIDRLSEEGALFVNSFCANSLCGPSRATILTGKHSHKNGFRRNGSWFDGNQPTFPPMLRAAGYQTAIIGKWHLASDPVGFDHWEVLPGQGSYYNPHFLQQDGSKVQREGYCTDLITERSLEWLKNGRDESKPFLLMCQHKAPHRNWSPALRHLDRWREEDVPEPDTLFDSYAGRSKLLLESEMSIRDHLHWGHDMKFHGESRWPEHFRDGYGNGEYQRMTPAQKAAWDAHYQPENESFEAAMDRGELDAKDVVRWKYQRYLKDYLRCVTAVDEGVGEILDYLDSSGLADSTVVIYSSDQGFYLGEHGWYDKRWMFEESLRMPFLIRWPGMVRAGTRSEAMIQNIDYAPTFLEMAGVSVPDDVQGRSLVPLLRGLGRAEEGWRDAIYYAYYENGVVHRVPIHDGIRTKHHKLMYFPRTQEWQLFDLLEDPKERRSLHADPAHRTRLAAMQRRYFDLRRFYEVNDATIPASRADEPWWKQRWLALNERVQQGDAEILFIGDSITQGWEDTGLRVWNETFASPRTVNLGFSGDRTEHVLYRLENGHLEGIAPRLTVLMIGTNNTGHSLQDPKEIADGIDAILATIRSKIPGTKVLLLGVFPRGFSPEAPDRLNNIAVNQYLRRFDDGEHIHYVDIGQVFLEPDGTISDEVMPDGLHLSEVGYERWALALQEKIRELRE